MLKYTRKHKYTHGKSKHTRRLSRWRLKTDQGMIKCNRVDELSSICAIIVDRFMLDGIALYVKTNDSRTRQNVPWQKYRLIGCSNRVISKYRLDIDWSSHFLRLLCARLFLKCYDMIPKRNTFQKKHYVYFFTWVYSIYWNKS